MPETYYAATEYNDSCNCHPEARREAEIEEMERRNR
jgi:hypothetical protein